MKLLISKEDIQGIINGNKKSENISVTKSKKLTSSPDPNVLKMVEIDIYSVFVMMQYSKINGIYCESILLSDTKTLKNIINVTLIDKISDIEIDYLTIEEERDIKLNKLV
jgi:hypothetical protein